MSPPRRNARGTRRTGARTGSAAIEFTLVLPILLLLLFAMINFATLSSRMRSVGSAAELLGDLVSRHDMTITAADLDDYFQAARLAMRPLDFGATGGVDIYVFQKGAAAPVTERWHRSYRGTTLVTGVNPPPVCAPRTVPTGSNTEVMMPANTDLVITVACANFIPPVDNYPAFSGLFQNIRIDKQLVMPLIQSQTLTCTDC